MSPNKRYKVMHCILNGMLFVKWSFKNQTNCSAEKPKCAAYFVEICKVCTVFRLTHTSTSEIKSSNLKRTNNCKKN